MGIVSFGSTEGGFYYYFLAGGSSTFGFISGLGASDIDDYLFMLTSVFGLRFSSFPNREVSLVVLGAF